MFTYDWKGWPVFSMCETSQCNSTGEGVPGGYVGRKDMLHGFSKGSSYLSGRPGLAASRKSEALGCVQLVISVWKLLK